MLKHGRVYEPQPHAGTRGAEGLTRLAFTVDDVYRMVAAGILHESDKVELIEGELVPMSPKGNHHEVLKNRLAIHLAKTMSREITLGFETTYRFSTNTYFEPDLVLYWNKILLSELSPQNTIVVIEISDTTLKYDLGRKAQLYARFGIQELWVIDAVKLNTRIFKQPGGDGYKSIEDKTAQDRLVPDAAPSLAVTLAELDLR